MSNRTITLTTNQAADVCAEISEKIKKYEERMAPRLALWLEIAELYCGKTGTLKENQKLSSNSTELYKAIRAKSNMKYRMLLGQKPPFELECMDILGYNDNGKNPEAAYKILKAEHYISNQMELARFPKGLRRALDQCELYGSVAIHNPFEPLRASFLGQKRFITAYRPMSMINCAFALDAYDIEESGWVAISDIQSKKELEKLKRHDPDGKMYNHAAIAEAQAQSDYAPKVNTWVTQRMAWSGYINSNFSGGMERVYYYGPLDSMDDGEEYCIEIVNRDFIIRCETYDGLKPVRVATIDTLDVEPLGNGMGDKFRGELKKIDDAESSLLNMVTLAGANMFAKQKSLTDEDMEWSVRNFGILSLENPDLKSIGPDARNLQAVANFLQDRIQKFRQASGATDTLQAIVSGEQATATSTSLAMNEAVRNESVGAELLAPTLIGDYCKMILQNAQKYNTQPFVLHINGAPITVMPDDLKIDVNVRVKTSTDQDFRPTKIARLMEAVQILMQAGPNAIPGHKTSAGPAIMEILKTLDVPNFQQSVTPLTEQDLMQMNVISQMQNPQAGQPGQAQGDSAQQQRANGERPGRKEQRVVNQNMAQGTMQTPAGQVLTAPGDESARTDAIRRASVDGDIAVLRGKQ